MSLHRQNYRKKKSRAIVSRERTVTTLTEDPESQLLIPTPTEEPAGAEMSSPFSISSSNGGGPNNNNFQPGAGFGYQGSYENNNGNSYMGYNNAQSEVFQAPQVAMPAGKDDTEILLNLKSMIKAGQHHYKPIPQPGRLKEIYEAGLVQDQMLRTAGYEGAGYDHNVYEVGSALNGTGPKTSLSTDAGRKHPLIQTKDAGDVPSALKSVELSDSQAQPKNTQGPRPNGNQANNVPPSSVSKPSNTVRNATDSRPPVTGSSDPASPRDRLRNNSVNRGPDSARPGEYSSRPRASSDASPTKSSTYDRRDDRGGRDWQPSHNNGTSDKSSRPDLDRTGPPSSGRPSNYPDSRDDDLRGPGPRDQRFFDRERDRERDSRDRDRDRDRDWDRDRGRDRRDYRPAMTNAPRPPPEHRHYEPNYGPDSFPRRSDTRPPPPDNAMDVDSKRPLPPPSSTTRVNGPIDDRSGRGPAPIADRPVRPAAGDDRDPPSARALPADSPSHSARLPPVDDRAARPPPAVRDSDTRPLSSSQSADAARSVAGDRGVRGPPPTLDDRSVRPPVPLEDRITHGPPPQDRVAHPPVSRADDRLIRRPSLEERITHAPNSASDRTAPPQDDRPARPGPVDRNARPVESAARPPLQDDRARVGRPDERPIRAGPPPGDRYTQPATSVHDRVPPRSGYVPPARASSVVRDDPRPSRVPPSPPATRNDYRPPPPRAVSRDREFRPAHRPESDRAYNGDRRGDAMDVDSPRFNDARPLPARRPSPPPARALSPPRGKSIYPPPPPLHTEPASYADSDRRYTGDRRDYPEDRQRTFSGPDDDYYSRADRSLPPARGNGWETREEHGRKISVTDSPPVRSYDNAPPRPAPSRTGNTYPDDRAYPPRDFDRGRYPPPPAENTVSRVRPRSPSPIRRVGPGDDDRPPIKRAREAEPAYSTGYYAPQPRRTLSASGAADDYPSRPLSTSRPPSRASYYDSRPAPISSAARVEALPYDRDYPPRDRPADVGSYPSGPSTYDRPRSPPTRAPPGGYSARGGYTRPDPRDDRRYMPPPPRGN